jgi:CIC family chloride channel protein
VNEDKYLVGILTLDEIRNIMFRHELYDRFYVEDLMIAPPGLVSIEDSMEDVMKMFEDTKAWNLPVVDGKVYKGFVSKSKIFNSYRDILKKFSDE